MARAPFLLPALLALALPALSQNLADKFRDNRAAWEESLAKGLSAPVRKATEAILLQDGPSVNPSDYVAMHNMVAMINLAARACVLEGAWEDAVAHLQKAAQAAADNTAAAETTFGRIRQEHQDNLKTWQADLTRLEVRMRDMDAQGGLTSDQIKARTDIRNQTDELRNAITRGEQALKEIEALSTLLKKEQQVYSASLAEWQGFLTKEKAEIEQKGSPAAYVAEKLEQVKGDDAKPLPERLAYARRLVRLDPGNGDCRRLLDGLMGKEEAPPPPKPASRKRRRR